MNERDWCEYVYWVYGLNSSEVKELERYDRAEVKRRSKGRADKVDEVVEESEQGGFGVGNAESREAIGEKQA